MKLTKTITLAALVGAGLLAGSNALQAQDTPQEKPPGAQGGPGGPGVRGRPNMDQIAKDLGLTDEQKTKFKAAMDDRMEKSRALRADTSLSQEDRRAKMKEIQEGFTAKLKEFLTTEQVDKLQKTMQRNRPAGGPGGAGADQAPKKAE